MNAASDWIFGRNPDHGNWVLILLKSGRSCVGRFIQKNNSWRTSGMSGPLSTKSVQCWAEIIKPNSSIATATLDLLGACEAAMRIVDLWYPGTDCDEEEAKALSMMRSYFEEAIRKAKQ